MRTFFMIFTVAYLFTLHGVAQEVMIAGWTFPNSGAAADTGSLENLNNEITTIGGTSELDFKNGFTSKAAQATQWNNGTDEKAWVVNLSTAGYTNLNISSRQQSGGEEPGPKYYKLQYSLDEGGSWIDIPDGDIIAENDWETSFVQQLSLPDDCDDMAQLMIRWVMTSEEASGEGGNVLETGKSKIDDIFIRGEMISATQDHFIPEFGIYIDKSSGCLNIHSDEEIESIAICTLDGKTQRHLIQAMSAKVRLNTSYSGSLIIYQIKWRNSHQISSGKVLFP